MGCSSSSERSPASSPLKRIQDENYIPEEEAADIASFLRGVTVANSPLKCGGSHAFNASSLEHHCPECDCPLSTANTVELIPCGHRLCRECADALPNMICPDVNCNEMVDLVAPVVCRSRRTSIDVNQWNATTETLLTSEPLAVMYLLLGNKIQPGETVELDSGRMVDKREAYLSAVARDPSLRRHSVIDLWGTHY